MVAIKTLCEPCHTGGDPLDHQDALTHLKDLHESWKISDDGKSISRRLTFKGYAKAVYTANMAAFLADQAGHHPDVTFGWGYCEVTFTTHDIGGLSDNDFLCAKRFDDMLSQ